MAEFGMNLIWHLDSGLSYLRRLFSDFVYLGRINIFHRLEFDLFNLFGNRLNKYRHNSKHQNVFLYKIGKQNWPVPKTSTQFPALDLDFGHSLENLFTYFTGFLYETSFNKAYSVSCSYFNQPLFCNSNLMH